MEMVSQTWTGSWHTLKSSLKRNGAMNMMVHLRTSMLISVAAAKADVFRKNDISVGIKFAKNTKIFDKIDIIKNRGVN